MDTQTKERLDDLLQDFEALRDRQVGYPCNQDFDYSALLPFLAYVPNNVGDPSTTVTSSATPTRWSARSSASSPT